MATYDVIIKVKVDVSRLFVFYLDFHGEQTYLCRRMLSFILFYRIFVKINVMAVFVDVGY